MKISTSSLNKCIAAVLLTAILPSSAISQDKDKKPPLVYATKVEMQTISDSIEALGTLRANESVNLTSNVTEIVSAIHFEDGERIEKGAILVEMTSAEEKALLDEARSTREEARKQYERVKPLLERGAAPASVVDQQKREFETAEARFQAIKSRLEDRLIIAPFSGKIGLRQISPGALVNPGDLIATLDDDSVMKLDFPVPSGYLPALSEGMKISASAPAIDSLTVEGTVASIDSRIDPVTRSISVRAILPNDNAALKPGLLMKVTLSKDTREAITIPENAIVPEGRKTFVLLANPEGDSYTVEKREVKTGARQPGSLEVVSGLSEGEIVIVHGTLKARPGSKVSIAAYTDGNESLEELIKKSKETK